MKQMKRAKTIQEEMTNLALMLVSWGEYKPRTPFNRIRREGKMRDIRKRLSELNEQYNKEIGLK